MTGESGEGRAEPLAVALADIGIATIATDGRGAILRMSPVAEALTGWAQREAAGQPLATVFRIEAERTRLPVTDPLAHVLATGTAAPLADHTVLIARGGSEMRIDHGAAPVRDASGAVVGALLIFCDVSERQRVVRGVEEARVLAESVVQTVREPLVVLGPDLRVRTANRAFYETFGATPAETEGRALFELGDGPWDIPRLRELLAEALAGAGHFHDFEVEREFAGIGRRSMVLNARRIPSPATPPGVILLAIDDRTEQRQAVAALAESEVRYRRLFEAAQDGILLVDPDTRRVFDANPFLTALLGYSHEELVGKELWEIGLFRDIEANKSAFRTLRQQGYIRYEDLPLRTHDDRGIEVEFVSNVYDVGDARVIQCNIRDVTDRKRAEHALQAAHDELEARVRARTAELARTNDALTAEIARRERAEAERRDLQGRLTTVQEDERRRIARELHDQMGQHLTALALGLKVVKDATPGASPTRAGLIELQALTDLIGKEVHALALELRPTALDDLGLQAALGNYTESWGERAGVEVDYQSAGLDAERFPAPVETALYRVIQEALTNVLKHAQARRVSVVLQGSSSHVVAVVEDDGRGFDADLSPSTGGTFRLGLLGMRERMELVGGTLTIDSAPGRGTTVIARVPLTATHKGPAMPDLRVFVVDDHAFVRRGLRAVIDAEPGMSVVGEASDGAEAVARVPVLLPDVVIVDVSMPGQTGSQVTERLRRECPQVKVLALTVHEDKGYIRQLLAAGAAGYVLKRSAPEALIDAIRVVTGGGVYLDPKVAAKVVGGFIQKPLREGQTKSTELSEREAKVARLTAAGHGNKEIAARLDLSVKTIETYRARAMEKLGLKSRAELVHYAFQKGWLQDG